MDVRPTRRIFREFARKRLAFEGFARSVFVGSVRSDADDAGGVAEAHDAGRDAHDAGFEALQPLLKGWLMLMTLA